MWVDQFTAGLITHDLADLPEGLVTLADRFLRFLPTSPFLSVTIHQGGRLPEW